MNYFKNTHVDIWAVDRECAFVLPDDHGHLSVNGIFLTNAKNEKCAWQEMRNASGSRLLNELLTDLVGGRKVL